MRRQAAVVAGGAEAPRRQLVEDAQRGLVPLPRRIMRRQVAVVVGDAEAPGRQLLSGNITEVSFQKSAPSVVPPWEPFRNIERLLPNSVVRCNP